MPRSSFFIWDGNVLTYLAGIQFVIGNRALSVS